MTERARRSRREPTRYWQVRCGDWHSDPVTDWEEADRRRLAVEDFGVCTHSHEIVECDKEGRPFNGGAHH
jgi:hypothetical protein